MRLFEIVETVERVERGRGGAITELVVDQAAVLPASQPTNQPATHALGRRRIVNTAAETPPAAVPKPSTDVGADASRPSVYRGWLEIPIGIPPSIIERRSYKNTGDHSRRKLGQSPSFRTISHDSDGTDGMNVFGLLHMFEHQTSLCSVCCVATAKCPIMAPRVRVNPRLIPRQLQHGLDTAPSTGCQHFRSKKAMAR